MTETADDSNLTELHRLQAVVLKATHLEDQASAYKQSAWSAKQKLQYLSLQTLEQYLKAERKGICFGTEHSGKTPQRFGVFDSSLLKYIYFTYSWEQSCCEETSSGRDTFIKLLCPDHLPENTSYIGRDRRSQEIDITSEILEQEGRFMTKVGGRDVSDTPVLRQYSPEIYQHFGLPPGYYQSVIKLATPDQFLDEHLRPLRRD